MATLTGSFGPPATGMIAKVLQIQTDIAALKTAAETLVNSSNSLMGDMNALGTTAGYQAGNALLILKGFARATKGNTEQAHGAASNALLAYDTANGGVIIQGGGGGR